MSSSADKDYLDSELLSGLRDLVEAYPSLERLTGEIAQFKVVIDANIAVADLIFKFRNPHIRQTAIEETVKSSAIKLYAPTWLETEMVSSTIPQVSAKLGIAEPVLLALWSEYREQIIWDDTLPDFQPLSFEQGDEKDIPYVALQKSLNAAAILSRDADIKRMGGTTVGIKFVLSLREYARASTYCVAVQVGGSFVSLMGIHAVVEMAKGVGLLLSRVPNWAKVLLIVFVILAIAHPASREKLREALVGIGEFFGDVWPDIEKFIDLAIEKGQSAQQALADGESQLTSSKKERLSETSPIALLLAERSRTDV